MFLPPTNHSLKQALYIMKWFWMMCWKTRRLQTMYAWLNVQMWGIYKETELRLSLRKQRAGEIKRNWNGLGWKSPSCFPARVDCLCYWECLENPPRLPSSPLQSCLSGNFQDNIYRLWVWIWKSDLNRGNTIKSLQPSKWLCEAVLSWMLTTGC